MSGYEVMTVSKPFYVTVTDPCGAKCGDEWVPITTRVLFERGNAFGFENLRLKFGHGEDSAFLSLIASRESGTHNRFSWEHE